MASKMLMNDLTALEEKYKRKMEYFDRKINENCLSLEYSPIQDKKLLQQYEYCCKAYHEVRVLIATHERVCQ